MIEDIILNEHYYESENLSFILPSQDIQVSPFVYHDSNVCSILYIQLPDWQNIVLIAIQFTKDILSKYVLDC